MVRILMTLLLVAALLQTGFTQTRNIDTDAAAIPEANCTSVDALASHIKQNFPNDSTRIRAIYVWIGNHIAYDVKRFMERDKHPEAASQTVADVLATRNAVCQGYTDLFVALCKAVGINAVPVSGYTKTMGKINIISHAWAAAQLNGQWYLFDPTWGAGYVKDDRFYRRFNNTFYKAQPVDFIVDHMPFDPMFEFLSYPLSNKDFIDGTKPVNAALFNYNDTLKQYVQLSDVQQKAAELRRLEAAGIPIDLLMKRQQFLKQVLQSSSSKDVFEEGVKSYVNTMDLYKTYIDHKNKQFSTIDDNDLKQMMDTIEQDLKTSRQQMLAAVAKNDGQRQARTNNVANIDRFWPQLIKEKQFVQQYLSTEKSQRKQLFMRR